MKSLTKAVFFSTLFSAGFVQAAESVKATPVNIDNLQATAQNYVAKHMVNISLNNLPQFELLVLTKTKKQSEQGIKSAVIDDRLIAD